MASVSPYKDGQWVANWREPDPTGALRANGSPVMVRRNKVLSVKTRKAAIRMANKLEQDARASGAQPQTQGSLSWFLMSVYLPHQKAHKAIKTHHRDCQHVNSILSLIDGEMKLASINRQTFANLIDAAKSAKWPDGHKRAGERRFGPRTVHHLWGFLKRAVGHAYREDLIKFNPRAEMLEAPKAPRRGPCVKYADADDTRKLVDDLHQRDSSDLADLVDLCFLTACRRQEALGLSWDNVHLDADPAWIMVIDVVEEAGGVFGLRTGTKTDNKTGQAGRRLFLVPMAADLLRKRREVDRGQDWNVHNLVFPHPVSGRVWRPSAVTGMVKRAADRIGVTAGLHSRRHGGITHLLEEGVPMDVVSQFAGHANTEMTQGQYGWITDAIAQKQIAAVGSVFGGDAPAAKSDNAELPPDVMLRAMDFAEKTGQPLESVIAALCSGSNLAAE